MSKENTAVTKKKIKRCKEDVVFDAACFIIQSPRIGRRISISREIESCLPVISSCSNRINSARPDSYQFLHPDEIIRCVLLPNAKHGT